MWFVYLVRVLFINIYVVCCCCEWGVRVLPCWRCSWCSDSLIDHPRSGLQLNLSCFPLDLARNGREAFSRCIAGCRRGVLYMCWQSNLSPSRSLTLYNLGEVLISLWCWIIDVVFVLLQFILYNPIWFSQIIDTRGGIWKTRNTPYTWGASNYKIQTTYWVRIV